MIAENSDYLNMFKKVDNFLISKFVFCNKTWIESKINIHINSNKIEDDIYTDLIKEDITSFIDQDRVKDYCDVATTFNFGVKNLNLGKNIFFQVTGYSNIAEASDKSNNNAAENFDIVDNFESKYLQAEGEEEKKTEKTVFKLQLSNGVDSLVGFEYEFLREMKDFLIKESFPKILILGTVEVRRGIILLKNNTIKLL